MPFVSALIASATTALTSAATALGFGAAAGTIASSIVQFGVSALINAAFTAVFGKKPTAQDTARELAQQTTEPAVRFVYGLTRATGTPAGLPVKGEYIYGAWILNSRASALPNFTLHLDKREVILSGDAFDLSGPGATATNDPFNGHLNVWISRGDHTAPPALFLSEAGYAAGTDEDGWKASDIWSGLTVVWLKIKAGDPGKRQERWPASPPLVEVEGKFSLVFDPRTGTTAWSDNHALCVRDALVNHPVRSYQPDQLHESFDAYGPNVCDEQVAKKDGTTEPRYIAAGTVRFDDGEIEDQLNPLMVSGAADFIRVGGTLGYAPGEYRAPALTLDYLLGDGIEFPDMLPGAELVNQLRVSYLAPERGYETADLQPWNIPDALTEDGGVPTVKTLDLPFCSSATQAMRVRKIAGLRLRRQSRITGGSLPPEAFDLIGGSTVSIALPAPYNALDGVYEVEGIHPGLDPLGENEGVALRMPAALVGHGAEVYAYDPQVDEEEVYHEPYDGTRAATQPPGAIAVTVGDGVNMETGGPIIPRIRFAFDPSPSIVLSYEYEYRLGGGAYTTGGFIDRDVRDAAGKVFGFINVTTGATYDIRVRAISSGGASDWVEVTGVIPAVTINLDIPVDGAATGSSNSITASFTAPNDPEFRAMEIFGSDTDDVNAATALGPPIYTAQNSRVNVTESGLADNQRRYYFARSRGDYTNVSAFTASVTAVTNPSV
ncbi:MULTISPECIES: phage tail protein [unclassified Sulfitobacter]|uniref:phage tail protein n=1 Tax=unclassified Sulfitobacter TaxID=196795 RepID=UPI0007C3D2A2|nr:MULTISPECIES: phage tail protein [unclassified Sulfitobacter]KZX98058.1 hypothetical protein A3721_06850 [Sulfitobacter sp. HI0023]KZY26827.1 hypothetical protein A3728_14755 [Sulfitobacter sp. HI0040]KZZ67318.1 hypothetical protein A3764_15235 [Sulfitobacter sp. HI0129]